MNLTRPCKLPARFLTVLLLSMLFASVSSQVSRTPVLAKITPEIIGVGGKVLLTGQHLGSARDAVVVFGGGVVATMVERHSSTQIVVRVPLGAKRGPIRVVTNVNAPLIRQGQQRLFALHNVDAGADLRTKQETASTQASLLSRGLSSNGIDRFVTMAFMRSRLTVESNAIPLGGVRVMRNRIIVDLNDFLSFDVANDVGKKFKANLVGHIPATNSYIYELQHAATDAPSLQRIMDSIGSDSRVADVCPDIEMVLKDTVTFADVDVVNHYKINTAPEENGREDVYATDRIQAPGAWNLIERFVGRSSIGPVKIAQLDTGVNQDHAEFDGVSIKKALPAYINFNIAGTTTILPDATALAIGAYDLGDDVGQHGTRVASLMVAKNGNALSGTDAGLNGLLHNPMKYELLVMRGGSLNEDGDNLTLTDFLISINIAAIWGADVMNASWGQPKPVDPTTDAAAPAIRSGLRKLAHQLMVFKDSLLLCIAAGNEAKTAGSYHKGEVTPFEDLNLNNKLDPGEDFDGDGVLGQGNYIGASLGTLPNVITVGAIDQQDQRASFSNFGSRKPASTTDSVISIAAPGVSVFTAGANPDNSYFNIGAGVNNRFQYSNGTSFSTPLTCGSAGLIKGICACYSPADLKLLLTGNGLDVNLTDGNTVKMTWRTLKTGYAVRKALLDHGYFGDDDPFTGVSKIVVTSDDVPMTATMLLMDVRRGADGRAEVFAARGIPNGALAARNASLTHDGKELSYISPATITGIPSAAKLYSYFFASGTTADYYTEGWSGFDGTRLGRALEFAPNGDLLYGLYTGTLFLDGDGIPIANVSEAQMISLTPTLVSTVRADSGVTVTVDPGPGETWSVGENMNLFDCTWRPDSTKWDLAYSFFFSSLEPSGANNILTQDYPAASVPIPLGGPPAMVFGPLAYAPDGFGWAAVDVKNSPGGAFSPVDVRTEFYTGGLTRTQIAGSPHMSNPVGPSLPVLYDLHWSPDGSELALAANKLVTTLRDARDVGDRAPKLIYTAVHGLFTVTWQW